MIDNFIKSLFLHYRQENDLSKITHITALLMMILELSS